ncbi:MAG: hypothetical protein ACRCTQ_02085 [Brevinemataceae bacterium]
MWKYKNYIFLVIILPVIVYTQSSSFRQFLEQQIGVWVLTVDSVSGHFNLFDSSQSDINKASLLFGPSIPSSFIDVRVDQKRQTFQQMKVLYPFGNSAGSQIDGIFLAGEYADVKVENAFFAVNMFGEAHPNTLGIALNLSNQSRSMVRTVCVKIMLDTDIGENDGQPLIYLSSGQQITNAFLLSEKIPPYIFLGNPKLLSEDAFGTGIYVYPFITTTKPQAILIGNWRRISSDQWIIRDINTSFQYDRSSSSDAGIALYFGPYTLEPGQYTNFGVAISQVENMMSPILDTYVLDKAVFTLERFKIQEMLNSSLNSNSNDTPFGLSDHSNRQTYRSNILSTNTSTSCSGSSLLNEDQLDQLLYKDLIWQYNLKLNSQIRTLDSLINDILWKNLSNTTFDIPPSQGIKSDDLYDKSFTRE